MISDDRVYYLKKVYVVLKQEARWVHFAKLVLKLKDKGIACNDLTKEEFASKRLISVMEEGFAFDTLYITDDETVLKNLSAENLPVAAYLHEENIGQDFSKVKYAFEKPEELEAEYLERVYRRYSGLPWEILQTKRCILRESIPEDIDAFYEIYRAPGMTRYTDALYEHKSSERAALKEYIEKVYHYYEFGIWTVILKENGRIIGRAGLNIQEGYELPQLGYMIGKPWQGKGIATEVCRAILEYAKDELGLNRIQVLIHGDNAASLRVAEKLGFCERKTVIQDGREHFLLVREV